MTVSLGSTLATVLLSNSADFAGATATAYADSNPWTLAAGGGTKTVYVKFVDAAGNITPLGESTGVQKACQEDPEPGTTA